MKVYYSGSFYGHGKYEHPGQEIPVQKSFSWAGQEGIIPSVYLCGKGLVIDICFRVPLKKIKSYQCKWNAKSNFSELNQEELEQIEQDSPFIHFDMEAIINGEQSQTVSMDTESWNPLEPEWKACGGECETRMDYYGCGRESGWMFARASMPWVTSQKPKLKSLSVRLKAAPVFYAGEHFKTGGQEAGRTISFCHPVSGEPHTLTIYNCESDTLPEYDFEGIREYPKQYQALTYEISPALLPGEFTVVDCADSDQPKPLNGKARSVSVIGGTDGPVSIFTAGKAAGELEKQIAFSALHYAEPGQVEWRMKFYVREKEDLYAELI